jgi:gamma-glutamylcyclotransferase
MTIHYFAYGSNMLTERLQKRCPSAKPKGVATVADWAFSFSKQSRHGCGMGTIVRAAQNRLFGVVFELDDRERHKLDAAEGVGYGYNRDDVFLVEMHSPDETLQTTTYIADPAHTDENLRPYDWYRALVLAGARQHDLPVDYISKIEAMQPIPDPMLDRQERLDALTLLKHS